MLLRKKGKRFKLKDKKKNPKTLKTLSSFCPVSLAEFNPQRSVIPKSKILMFF